MENYLQAKNYSLLKTLGVATLLFLGCQIYSCIKNKPKTGNLEQQVSDTNKVFIDTSKRDTIKTNLKKKIREQSYDLLPPPGEFE